METTCKNCRFFVNEAENDIDNYTHEYALQRGEGFCLLRDFFWNVNIKTKACEEYSE